MEVGNKIKLLRLKCGLTQEELADRCELSKGFISQVENDMTGLTITTLEDIIMALGTTLKQFFTEQEEEKIVFKASDYSRKESENSSLTWLVTNSTKNEMEPILVELKPNGMTDRDVPHEGEEFGHVISGTLVLVIGNDKHKCKTGDSFYFKPEKVHYIKNEGKETVKFLWVSSPPNF